MGYRFTAVNGDLDPVTTPGRGKELRFFPADQRPVAQYVIAHAIPGNTLYDLFQVLPVKWFAPLEGDVQDRALIQFCKELQPLLCRQIMAAVTRSRKMAAISAPEIAVVGDGNIDCPRRLHGFL
jgi:hypothetical protein